MSAASDLLRWSGKEFPLSEFDDRLSSSLPVVIVARSGFDGGDMLHSISSGEMFWVDGVRRQNRIVVSDAKGTLYSVPANYDLDFHLISCSNRSRPMKLWEALGMAVADPAQWGATPSVVLQNDDGAVFVIGDGTGSRLRLGTMHIVDKYDETFLRAHTIDLNSRAVDGVQIVSNEILLPTYVGIEVDVATGFRNNSDPERFKTWINEQKNKIQSVNHKPAKMCTEIVQIVDVSSASATQNESNSKERNKIYEHLKPIVKLNTYNELLPPVDYEIISTTASSRNQYGGGGGSISAQKQPPLNRANSLQQAAPRSMHPPSMTSSLTVEESTVRRMHRGQSDPNVNGGILLPGMVSPAIIPPRTGHLPPSHALTSRPLPPPPVQANDECFRSAQAKLAVAAATTVGFPASNMRQSMGAPPGQSNGGASAYRVMPAFQDVFSTEPQRSPPLPPLRPLPVPGAQRPTAAGAAAATNVGNLLPRDLARLSVDDVSDCLRQLHLDKYVETFRMFDVDGTLLTSLDEQVLVGDLAMTRLEARKLMLFVKQGWRPNRSDHRLTGAAAAAGRGGRDAGDGNDSSLGV